MDDHFKVVFEPQLAGLTPELRNDKVVSYIDRFGVIPLPVASKLRAFMRNGSVANQADSADLISKLQEINPQSLNELNGKDVAYSKSLTSAIRGGLTPDEAVAQTKEIFNPLREDVRKSLKIEFDALDINTKKDFQQRFGTGFWAKFFNNEADFSKSALGAKQAEEDYMNEFQRQFILNGGNKEDASSSALNVIQDHYGATAVTGSERIVKYPPENYYAVKGLDNDWMTNQVQEQVNNITDRKVDLDDIAVVADIETSREVHNKTPPRYTIMLKNDNGSYEPVIKNGQVMRMKFDSSEAVRKRNEEWEIERQEKIDEEKISLRRKRVWDKGNIGSTQPELATLALMELLEEEEDKKLGVKSLLGGS